MNCVLKKDDLIVLLLNYFGHPLLKDRKFALKEIKKYFFSNYKIFLDDLKEALIYLERYGFIYKYPDNTYALLVNDKQLVQGNIHIDKTGKGFLQVEEEIFKINRNDLNGALDGDNVVIRIKDNTKGDSFKAVVEKIVERKDGLLVVEVTQKHDKKELKACDVIFDYSIVINSLALKSFVDGDKLLVRVDRENNNGVFYAGLVKYIGYKYTPSEDFKFIAAEYFIPIEFSSAALEESEKIPLEVSAEELSDRVDLTNELIFSVDNADTKDRDDAVSLSKDELGNFVLGVHIADVSHYIKPGSALWNEAMKRSASVYMGNSVIPMLPYKISNVICSLNPNVLRLTFSCIITLSPKGEIIDYKFLKSYIKSRQALTYGMVNEVINEGVIKDEMVEYAETLLQMKKLSDILEKRKINRGYVRFGCNDVKVIVDQRGNPLEFIPRKVSSGEQIIENFMLVAGECAAHFGKGSIPYRVCDVPEVQQMNVALDVLKKSGLKVKFTEDVKDMKILQKFLTQIKNADEKELAGNIILRSLPKARYSGINSGHFGLALDKYCHFTSPIRRFPDLLLHAILKNQINKEKSFIMTSCELNKACEYFTRKEDQIISAERNALKLNMVQYANNHLGESFSAVVTYINANGIYIRTSNGIEGKLDPQDIEVDDFIYNSRNKSFIGKFSKIKIQIGTHLDLVILDTKKEYRTINFGINKEDLLQLKKVKN